MKTAQKILKGVEDRIHNSCRHLECDVYESKDMQDYLKYLLEPIEEFKKGIKDAND